MRTWIWENMEQRWWKREGRIEWMRYMKRSLKERRAHEEGWRGNGGGEEGGSGEGNRRYEEKAEKMMKHV